MPAFQVQAGKGPYQRGGATAWGGGDRKAAPAASPDGSNPLPATSQSPAAQVYSQPAAQASPQAQPFSGGSGADAYRQPAQSGHWDMGQQGAEGAWSNGYNPHWEQDQQPASAPAPQAPQVRQERQERPHPQYQYQAQAQAQQAPVAAPAASPAAYQDPRRGTGTASDPNAWDNDPRSNPNNTMSIFENPTTHQRYSDFDNAALRATPGGTLVGKDSTTTWDPQGIYKDPTSPFYIPPGDPRWGGA